MVDLLTCSGFADYILDWIGRDAVALYMVGVFWLFCLLMAKYHSSSLSSSVVLHVTTRSTSLNITCLFSVPRALLLSHQTKFAI